MPKSLHLIIAVSITLSVISPAHALTDDVATVALWQMESIYYDTSDLPWTADDDSQNPGRNRDFLLFRSGLNETPPVVTTGYDGSSFEFNGGQFAYCSNFWQSSNTELKLDYMIYFRTMPTEVGAAAIYVFDKNSSNYVFQSAIWPSASGDYLRFTVFMTSGQVDGDVVVQNLKNRWLHVVGSYDASKNYSFSVTDLAAGTTTTVTKTGANVLRSATCDITFGSTSPSLGSKPVNRNFNGYVDAMKVSNKVVTPHYSFSPAPTSGSTIYVRPDNLTWSKGLVALGSDVFFGTSSSAVASATKPALDIDGNGWVDFGDFAVLAAQWQGLAAYPSADINKSGLVNYVDLYLLLNNWLTSTASSSPLYLGGTAQTTIATPTLAASKTYYWRVDSLNNSENTAGSVWSFTTGPAATSNPSPATASTGVSTDANSVTLTWTPGFNATSYNIYFGTQTSPSFLMTVTGTSMASPMLAPGTKYYWRVDAVAGGVTTTGTVWNFTTGSISATTPSPAIASTNVTFPLVGVDLTWASTFKPGMYNVYFGTTTSPGFAGSTTSDRFRSPAVGQNTTYYWRVDCVSVFGTVTGTTWSFTTATPAFPQAQGFGRFAKGGRGGTIYHVTNLNDTGTGSFRDAISASNRIVVFDVGGQITCATRLGLSSSNIYIAGQTAPGQGISVAGPGIGISGDNIIVRYMRFRYTNDSVQDDCFTISSASQNVIVDHVSASWATDEVLSVGGIGAANVTVQWTMVTEGSNALGHSKGSLLEMPILSWHHNIYAHNDDRNPKNKGTFDYRNNIVYNWGMAPYIAGGNTGAQCFANCVGNYYIAGVDSDNPNYMVIGGNNNYHIYFSDNRLDSNRNGLLDGVDNGTAMMDPAAMPVVVTSPYEYPPVTTTSPEVAYTQVLANAGCSLSRDSIDTRIINDIVSQTGYIITTYTDHGGLGTLTTVSRPAGYDTDQDGMPDAWEDAHGLSKTNAADGGTVGVDGYTNLENYLNSLAVYPTE
jgi:hypothetical protein